MKKKEKILIAILLIITIILIIVVCVRNNSTEEGEENNTEISNEVSEESEESESDSEYVTTLSDGTRLNTSEALSETKTIGGLEITNIQLTESDNVTQLLATITNTSEETDGGYIAILTLYDEEGNVLIEMKPYIAELEPGESTQLNTSAVFDYAEAYDFSIEKQ